MGQVPSDDMRVQVLRNPVCDVGVFHNIMNTAPPKLSEEIYMWKIACLYRFILEHEDHDIGINCPAIFNQFNENIAVVYRRLFNPDTRQQAQKNLYYIYLGTGNTEYLQDISADALRNFTETIERP